jgi:hypothetical protein
MKVDWTQIEDCPKEWLEGEKASAIDGTDQWFYETPWCEGDEGDTWLSWDGGQEPVELAQHVGDAVVFRNVPVQAALPILKRLRKAFLEEEVARLQKELKALSE